MVEAAYRHHGLHYRYLNTEVPPEKLADAVAGARAMNWAGFNCSIPHKVAVIEHLDGLGESAGDRRSELRCASQWPVHRREHRRQRVFKSLQEVVDPAGKKLVMFGAGGAARAIGVECALAGAAHITVVNRSADRGNELVTLLNDKTPVTAVLESWDGDYTVPAGTDVVINATSIGLAAAEGKLALDLDSLTAEMVVADVIPNPPRTQLVRDAEAKGCTVIDGLGMLVNQASPALSIGPAKPSTAM